jgi:hypothetical protein
MRTYFSLSSRTGIVAMPPVARKLGVWTGTASACLFLAIWLSSYLSMEIYESLNFNGFPADGPFQLFNPLRRIAAGQIPGIDFQFFHGIGVPYLHYPLFWLFGKTIFASELSRNLTSAICYTFSLFLFAWVSVRRDFKKTLYFSALAACFSELLWLGKTASVSLNIMFTPGNSLLGVRSTLPIIAFALLLSGLKPSVKAVSAGCAFASSLFVSTEHGIALIGSFVVTGCILLTVPGLIRRTSLSDYSQDNGQAFFSFRFYCLTLCLTACGVILIYLLFCGYQGGLQALKYNLLEVPKDQFWYFGVPPNRFATSWLDFPRVTARGFLTLVIVICWLGSQLVSLLRNRTRFTFTEVTTVHMLSYGILSCVSCLGMLETGYLFPMLRVVLLIILTLAFREDWSGKITGFLRKREAFSGKVMIAGSVGFIILSFSIVTWNLISRMPPDLKTDPRRPLPQLSIPWNNYLAEVSGIVMQSEHDHPQHRPVIWSTYAGLLEDRLQIFHPADDYIIHALGPVRRQQYLEKFRQSQPDFVQTVRRSLFLQLPDNHDYEQWLQNTTWDFYEDVLRNYEITKVTDRFFLWKRTTDHWVSPPEQYEEVPVSPGTDYLKVPDHFATAGTRLLVVRLKYRIENPWRQLPVIGSLPRYLVEPENAAKTLPISLPPYADEIRFPLILRPGTAPGLRLQTHSLISGANFIVTSVAFRKISLSDNQQAFLED